MSTNIKEDFQICISAPLNYVLIVIAFVLLFNDIKAWNYNTYSLYYLILCCNIPITFC